MRRASAIPATPRSESTRAATGKPGSAWRSHRRPVTVTNAKARRPPGRAIPPGLVDRFAARSAASPRLRARAAPRSPVRVCRMLRSARRGGLPPASAATPRPNPCGWVAQAARLDEPVAATTPAPLHLRPGRGLAGAEGIARQPLIERWTNGAVGIATALRAAIRRRLRAHGAGTRPCRHDPARLAPARTRAPPCLENAVVGEHSRQTAGGRPRQASRRGGPRGPLLNDCETPGRRRARYSVRSL